MAKKLTTKRQMLKEAQQLAAHVAEEERQKAVRQTVAEELLAAASGAGEYFPYYSSEEAMSTGLIEPSQTTFDPRIRRRQQEELQESRDWYTPPETIPRAIAEIEMARALPDYEESIQMTLTPEAREEMTEYLATQSARELEEEEPSLTEKEYAQRLAATKPLSAVMAREAAGIGRDTMAGKMAGAQSMTYTDPRTGITRDVKEIL